MKATFFPALLNAVLAGLLPAPSRAESMIVQWEQKDPPSHAVAVDAAGNVIATGGFTDYHTAKYAAADGALLWETRHNGPGNNNDSPRSLAVDSAGNAIVTGNSHGGASRTDYYTVKYAAADGALLWERRYNGPANDWDYAWAVAVDSEDNVIVTGVATTVAGGDGAIYTAKYAATNGDLLWERYYKNFGGAPVSLALDMGGNVIVAGNSADVYNEIYLSHFYTAKYAAGNGALLWERRSVGPESTSQDVAVDKEGNIVVTGWRESNTYTAKYAAANGALLWERLYYGPGGSADFVHYVEVDQEGNAIITGYSEIAGGDYDFFTAKYAAANGALLWEKRYNGPDNGRDSPRSLAVDGEGNAIVTGRSVASSGKGDSYTAKYAAVDGALLWEKRYNGTTNDEDNGRAVAVDSAGGFIVVGETNVVKYVPEDLDLDDDGLLDSWEVKHFGGIAGQGALDDTDQDGVVELLELAFGSDPRKPDGGATPALVVENGYLTATIVKQPGVRYLVETGAMLNGDFSATSTTVLPGTAEMLKVRDNVPIGTQPARFLRVLVTGAP